MGQRMNKSKLFFGQLAGGQKPSGQKDTLSSLYEQVGTGQTAAVKEKAAQTEQATEGLMGNLGLAAKDKDGKPEVGLAAGSTFTPSVDTGNFAPNTTVATPTTGTTFTGDTSTMTEEELAEAIKAAEGNVDAWKASGLSALEYFRKLLKEKQDAAGKAATDAQERASKDKLGQRAEEMSELEKAAQNYQNTLATEPGTSNIGALAQLSKFYDPRYAGLESGLAQGEISLAREQAKENVEEMGRAEEARAAALGEYSKSAKELGQTLQEKVGAAGTAEEERLKKFYETGGEDAGKLKTKLEGDLGAKVKVREDKEKEDLKTISQELENDPTYKGIENILDQIGGRGSNNWLNTRGSDAITPLKQEMLALSNDAKGVAKDVLLSAPEKTKRLNEIKGKVKEVRGKVAGELAAFLGDENTDSGDALDAAEQIMAAGLIDSLSPDQQIMIIRRIEKTPHMNTRDKNRLSSPEKLVKIYKAFGGPLSAENLLARAQGYINIGRPKASKMRSK